MTWFPRISQAGLTIQRLPESISRYTMLRHVDQVPNILRWNLLHSASQRYSYTMSSCQSNNNLTLYRIRYDGLTDLQYKRIDKRLEKLFTNITVQLKMPEYFHQLEEQVTSCVEILKTPKLITWFLQLVLCKYF